MSGNKWKAEVGMGNSECGVRNAENISMEQSAEDRRQKSDDRGQTTDKDRYVKVSITQNKMDINPFFSVLCHLSFKKEILRF